MNIIEAMDDKNLFRDWFHDPTWSAWRALLKAIFGLPLSADEFNLYTKHTGRAKPPQSAFREAWLVVGRRGGKSLVAALVAVFLACFKDYRRYLKPGEVGTIAVIAADRRQARTILRYVRGFLALPMLKKLVTADNAESIEFSTGVVIEVHTASFRSVRGYTLVAAIGDEIAFWRSEDSAAPDKEIVSALRPATATIPDALLLFISSPYSRRGAMWDAYAKHFGKSESAVLIWQASTRAMNPSVPESIVNDALDEDEAVAKAEYLAEFRRDLEPYVAREVLDQCKISGRFELPPVKRGNEIGGDSWLYRYFAFVDPSGGSQDSMTLAIAHTEIRPGRVRVVVVDAIREVKPPFSPAAIVHDFVVLLRQYGIRSVNGDHYAGEWAREPFSKLSVHYVVSDKTKSDIYRDTLTVFNSGRAELLDHPRLHSQLLGLERRTARGGRDSIDHAPRAHDDVANAVCGVIDLCEHQAARGGRLLVGGDIRGSAFDIPHGASEEERRQREREQELTYKMERATVRRFNILGD